MRIALVTHKLVRGDGQGRVNLEIAAAAVRRGWDVTLIASQVCPTLLAFDRVRWVRIQVERWPTELLRNQKFAWSSWRWLVRNRAQLDIVCVNGFITWAAAHVNLSHYIHSAWLQSPYRKRENVWSLRGAYHRVYTAVNAALEKRAYAQAGCVIAVSEPVRRQLVAIGIDPERLRVISNGVDTQEFHPGRADRTRLGVPADAVTGIFVGQAKTPHKNLHTVLQAMSHCPGVHLIVAGALGDDTYPRMAAQLGLNGRIHFLGFREDIPELMRAADLVVFPSLHDSSGLVLFEGMASGLPVITARTVGGSEHIDRGCAVILRDPEGTLEMAQAIASLAESPTLRASMGARGREQALKLDFSSMADRYCDLFDVARRTLQTSKEITTA
jgi:glycosyltransferase involved in cell wall biosynthesis